MHSPHVGKNLQVMFRTNRFLCSWLLQTAGRLQFPDFRCFQKDLVGDGFLCSKSPGDRRVRVLRLGYLGYLCGVPGSPYTGRRESRLSSGGRYRQRTRRGRVCALQSGRERCLCAAAAQGVCKWLGGSEACRWNDETGIAAEKGRPWGRRGGKWGGIYGRRKGGREGEGGKEGSLIHGAGWLRGLGRGGLWREQGGGSVLQSLPSLLAGALSSAPPRHPAPRPAPHLPQSPDP